MIKVRMEKWHVRWYNYNKHKIPIIFTIIGTLVFTLFLDFRTGNIDFKSHISAINVLTNKVVGFYLFAIYMNALVQLANSIAFAKRRSPISLFMFTILNLLQIYLVYLYVNVFHTEVLIRTDNFVIPPYGYLSMNIMITGAIFYIIATIFAWIYVDWKCRKIEN